MVIACAVFQAGLNTEYLYQARFSAVERTEDADIQSVSYKDQRCKDRHKNNNAGDLSGDLIEQFKGLTSEIDFHLLSDNSRDVKDFIVIFTPLVVEFTELSILVWLCFFRPAVFLIAVLEISKRHVFTFLHLPEYPLKIRPLVFRTAAVTSGNMTVNQLGNGIIRDPF